MRAIDYFDRLLIVNLPERQDRRNEMLRELQSANIPLRANRCEFFPAVRVSDAAGFPNAGYRGCFLSHLTILEKMKLEQWETVLIMEDDLSISPRFRIDEEKIVSELQKVDWGFAFFGNTFNPLSQEEVHLEKFSEPLLGTHFYAVHRRILDRLLEFMKMVPQRPHGDPDGGCMSPDAALSFFRMKNPDIESYIVLPNFGQQRSSRSDIAPRWFDGVPIIRELVASARKLKVKWKGF